MSPEDFKALRLEVKKLLIDRDLDGVGKRVKLLAILREKLGRPVNKNSLCMAMTGYRTGASSAEILRNLKEILTCDFIHASEDTNK